MDRRTRTRTDRVRAGASLRWTLVALAILTSGWIGEARAAAPIALHPENPHYFLWRDKPTILITSGEHLSLIHI